MIAILFVLFYFVIIIFICKYLKHINLFVCHVKGCKKAFDTPEELIIHLKETHNIDTDNIHVY